MKEKHFPSRMLTCAGTLMGISGVLMAVGAKPAYGGILFASAACMLFAARVFRAGEDRQDSMEEEQKAQLTDGNQGEQYGNGI